MRRGEVYNICSGRVWSIQGILDYLLSESKVKVRIEQDQKRMRPSDMPILYGDWTPEIPFKKTLEDLLNYWRERV